MSDGLQFLFAALGCASVGAWLALAALKDRPGGKAMMTVILGGMALFVVGVLLFVIAFQELGIWDALDRGLLD